MQRRSDLCWPVMGRWGCVTHQDPFLLTGKFPHLCRDTFNHVHLSQQEPLSCLATLSFAGVWDLCVFMCMHFARFPSVCAEHVLYCTACMVCWHMMSVFAVVCVYAWYFVWHVSVCVFWCHAVRESLAVVNGWLLTGRLASAVTLIEACVCFVDKWLKGCWRSSDRGDL